MCMRANVGDAFLLRRQRRILLRPQEGLNGHCLVHDCSRAHIDCARALAPRAPCFA